MLNTINEQKQNKWVSVFFINFSLVPKQVSLSVYNFEGMKKKLHKNLVYFGVTYCETKMYALKK